MNNLLQRFTCGWCVVCSVQQKYGGYSLVGVHGDEEQMDKLLGGQTSDSSQSEDESRPTAEGEHNYYYVFLTHPPTHNTNHI